MGYNHGRTNHLLTLLVLVFTSILFTARLGARSLWSEEVRWAEIPREMQQSGDYFWPTFNGRTYYDKPLGSYWLVLLARTIPGLSEESAARLPCALSALLAVWLTMSIGRRLHGPAAGPLAGLVLATSFSFVFFARHASTDVETVAGMLAALWLFLRNERRPDGWWTVPFWLVMALTSLTKGLLGFVLPVLVIVAYQTSLVPVQLGNVRGWARQLFAAQRWFFHRKTILAVPLAAIVYLVPFVISSWQTGADDGLAMVFRENIRRFVDPVNHRGPVYLYAWVIFELLAPWSLLLPAALWQAMASGAASARREQLGNEQPARVHPAREQFGRDQPGAGPRSRRFALVFFWSIFIFFTLSASRRSYYLLPILPAAALLIAYLLVAAPDVLTKPTRWLMLGLQPRRAAWALGIIAAVAMAGIFLLGLPALEDHRTRRPFVLAVRQQVGDELDHLALFDERDTVFYLAAGQPIAEFPTPEALEEAISRRKIRWVLVRRSEMDRLRSFLRPVIWETVQPWDSARQQDAKLVLMEAR